MRLNELRDEIFLLATKQGFHGIDENGINQDDLCRKLMLVNSELCEAMEAERNGRLKRTDRGGDRIPCADMFKEVYKGSIEEEIADAVIRLADIAGMMGMNLEWWVKAKMAYNHEMFLKNKKLY